MDGNSSTWLTGLRAGGGAVLPTTGLAHSALVLGVGAAVVLTAAITLACVRNWLCALVTRPIMRLYIKSLKPLPNS